MAALLVGGWYEEVRRHSFCRTHCWVEPRRVPELARRGTSAVYPSRRALRRRAQDGSPTTRTAPTSAPLARDSASRATSRAAVTSPTSSTCTSGEQADFSAHARWHDRFAVRPATTLGGGCHRLVGQRWWFYRGSKGPVRLRFDSAPCQASSRIQSATCSPIMMQVRLMFARGMVGMIDASTTRRFRTARTRQCWSVTAIASSAGPMRAVPQG